MARNVFYGKKLHSLKWQPETNECVSATDSVKMRVRILTSCKNRVKTSYKQEEGKKILRVKETKRGGPPQPLPKGKGFVAALMHRTWGSFLETKSQRDKGTKRRRDEETKR